MSSDKKKNMFMSFRDMPRDMTSVAEEVSLNVRRGLAKLERENGNGNENTANLPDQPNDFTIEDMTSIDICNDSRAHYRSHEWKIRDIIYMKKCWKAICCNANLFKDKVNFKRKMNCLRDYFFPHLSFVCFFFGRRLCSMLAVMWVFCRCSALLQVQNMCMRLIHRMLSN